MTEKPYTESKLDSKPLVIGERVLADCQRRARELENSRPVANSVQEKREVERLAGFQQLHMTANPNSPQP